MSRLDAAIVLELLLKMPFLENPIAIHLRTMDPNQSSEELVAKFEELSVLESEFEQAELEIRKQLQI